MTRIKSDFTLLQCREALARLDDSIVDQAINIATSLDPELIQRAGRNPDLGPAVFWVQEWMAAERIESRREAMTRRRVFPVIRRERRNLTRRVLGRINLTLGFAVYLSQLAIWFSA